MADTVIILGAGASKRSGVPVMNEFLDEARRLYQTDRIGSKHESTDRVEKDRDSFKRVLKAQGMLNRVHSKAWLDVQNVEPVFAAFEMAQTLGQFPGLDDKDIASLSPAMKRVIVRTVEESLDVEGAGPGFAVRPYLGLVGTIRLLREKARPPHRISLITFNYDIAAELALSEADVSFSYGFGDSNDDDAVDLFKLHGSINWPTCQECGDVVPWDVDDFVQNDSCARKDINDKESPTRLRIGSRSKRAPRCAKHSTKYPMSELPVVVPPTWNKSAHREKIRVVWRKAASELHGARNVLVYGYSLPASDAFFHHLYALGTDVDKHLKRFWVFNPDNTGKVEDRFRDLLGPGALNRFEYLEFTCQEGLALTSEWIVGEVPGPLNAAKTGLVQRGIL